MRHTAVYIIHLEYLLTDKIDVNSRTILTKENLKTGKGSQCYYVSLTLNKLILSI